MAKIIPGWRGGRDILLVLLLSSSANLFPADMKISLYHDHLVQSALFTVVSGYYTISGDGMEDISAGPGASLFLLHRHDTMYVRDHSGDWYGNSRLRISGGESSVFSLKPSDPLLESREYYGNLEAGISMKGFSFINEVDLETYVMGVTESEAGPACPLEYYKVQAILCRTFALKNIERHQEEGFQLCDGVHCQAYKGRHIWNEDVEIGTEVTTGLVVCDRDTVLINPVYHSNSGGETRGAETVWLKEESYLKPVLDPFSEGQRNARWERSMHVDDWLMYLLSYGIRFPENADTTALEMRLRHRTQFYRVLGDSISVRNIRDDFRYRSDFFEVILEDKMIRIRGRGYGHGVGLSQEGAIEMARRRYHYTAILNYYYHQIRILPYFFLEEDILSQEAPVYSP